MFDSVTDMAQRSHQHVALLLVCAVAAAETIATSCTSKPTADQRADNATCTWFSASGSREGCASRDGAKIHCSEEFGLGVSTRQQEQIGAGCAFNFEEQTCHGGFCLNRVLLDRWAWVPRTGSDASEMREVPDVAHCSRHCGSQSDCAPGFSCCDPEPAPFCLLARYPLSTESDCAVPCAENYLGCEGDTVCCESFGAFCVSAACPGICPI